MVIIFIVAIIIYRIVVSIPLFQHETLKSQAQVIANLSGAVVNLVLIMALGRFYEKLAYKLTTWGERVVQFTLHIRITQASPQLNLPSFSFLTFRNAQNTNRVRG
jgi:anoctamin-7